MFRGCFGSMQLGKASWARAWQHNKDGKRVWTRHTPWVLMGGHPLARKDDNCIANVLQGCFESMRLGKANQARAWQLDKNGKRAWTRHRVLMVGQQPTAMWGHGPARRQDRSLGFRVYPLHIGRYTYDEYSRYKRKMESLVRHKEVKRNMLTHLKYLDPSTASLSECQSWTQQPP